MRPLPEWTQDDLQQLVQQQRQEDGELEYKDSRALEWPKGDNRAREARLNEISKDVSALANSNGGLLVYGIAEKDHLPVRVDDGVDPKTHGREWLEAVIRDNLQDAPSGLRVFAIPVGNTGRIAYVIDVPLLPQGCQARDKRYYRRRSYRVDMLDDWEVRELLSRSAQPRVALNVTSHAVEGAPQMRRLAITLSNTGTVRVHDWQVPIEIPRASIANVQLGGVKGRRSYGSGATYETLVVRFSTEWSPHVLFPKEKHELLQEEERPLLRLFADDEHLSEAAREELTINWTVFADDLPAQPGSVRIVDLVRGSS